MASDVVVIGAGWAGLAAAIAAHRAGHRVTLLEMAAQAGGRARSLDGHNSALRLDNGQHILIGAYTATLGLMHTIGVDPAQALLRQPLALLDASGQGLRLPAGAAVPAFVRAVLALRSWPWRDRFALLGQATGWMLHGFRCPPEWTVARLAARLPGVVRAELIEPLCVAALNTPADAASAQVFLRVLKDALFAGPGASDLLLPKAPLATLLPEPALTWLVDHGAQVRLGQRVQQVARTAQGWQVDGKPCDHVVLACSAAEAARLTGGLQTDWSRRAAAFTYEPIVTVYLRCAGARLAAPMVALPSDAPDREPAQFAFDLGAISGPHLADRFAYVVSGAAQWTERGLRSTEEAVRVQASASLRRPGPAGLQGIEVLQTVAEKRATFRCTPGLQRPPRVIAPGLQAAGDYIEGPYPATLEGAVRSGLEAAAALG
jgi:squalene-associated FAD-dependent desaturase